MSILLNGECLEELKDIQDKSVDLIFCDLPYGQTSCKWDCLIDLDKLWIEFMRIKKLNTPIIMTCTTKFGISLINSCPKKCPFRYDLVWCKSASAGFLSAKKMPMRKHEMIYVFYEKLPFYDLSSHKHKFLNSKNGMKGQDNLCYGKEVKQVQNKKYDPPLPTSLIKEGGSDGSIEANEDYDKRIIKTRNTIKKEENYGKGYLEKKVNFRKYNPKLGAKGEESHLYEPPLPTSLIKEGLVEGQTLGDKGNECYGKFSYYNNGVMGYEPPLPTSLIKEGGSDGSITEEYNGNYGKIKQPDYIINNVDRNKIRRENKKKGLGESAYEPPLPTSLIKEGGSDGSITEEYNGNYGKIKQPDYIINNVDRNKIRRENKKKGLGESAYEPPLPNTLLEIKSTRGKHSTEKPVALMEWILKYYSKEGDVVLDPTMGSGSMGVACVNMNRNFIGIEKDEEIYEVAVNRIED